MTDLGDGPGSSVSVQARARSRRSQAADIRGASQDGGGDLAAILSELASGPAGEFGLKVPVSAPMLEGLSGVGQDPQQAKKGKKAKKTPGKEADDDATLDKVEGDLFVKGEGDDHSIAMNDVKQGAIGDCYFVALLASIARVRPDIIQNMIKDNGDGTYTVTFHATEGLSGAFGDKTGKSVTVDNRFWQSETDPDDKEKKEPTYAKAGDVGLGGPELWVMVIEKAWAQAHGGYAKIVGGVTKVDSREAVTGHKPDGVSPSSLSNDKLFARIEAHFSTGGEPALFWSKTKKADLGDDKKVVPNHGYALKSVDSTKKTVSLYNPWGTKHIEDVDMAFIKDNFRYTMLVNVDDK